MIHGFLNLDKPAGITSHTAVGAIRRLTGQRRVGHGGTLDPLATGVLPIAIGVATRLLEYLVEKGRKVYRGEVLLGTTTTTDDAEGEVLARRPVPTLSEETIHSVLERFTGRIAQVPPRYSAIQVGGQRLYDLARRGAEVSVPSREVFIERLDLLSWEPPVLTIAVTCGKGTYIRSLARDIGEQLGCGGHLRALRRLAVGPLDIATALPLERLRAEPDLLNQSLLPLEVAVADWPRVDADATLAQHILQGRTVDLPLGAEIQRARVHTADGQLLAIVRRHGEQWRPNKVFQVSSITPQSHSAESGA